MRKKKKNKFIDEDEDLIVRLINRLLTQGVWPMRDEQVRAHLSSPMSVLVACFSYPPNVALTPCELVQGGTGALNCISHWILERITGLIR